MYDIYIFWFKPYFYRVIHVKYHVMELHNKQITELN